MGLADVRRGRELREWGGRGGRAICPRPRLLPPMRAARAWLALREGQAAEAEQGFARALLAEPRDARALFGAANLAYELGDGERAWQSSLALLELAAREADPLALQLAAATLARISRVLTELPDRRAAEDRLLALDGSRLPWQAHYALALVIFDIARRRGDSALLGKAMADAGCVPGATMVGRSGRLPFLDLDAEGYLPEPEPRSLLHAGCQLQLNLPGAAPWGQSAAGQRRAARRPLRRRARFWRAGAFARRRRHLACARRLAEQLRRALVGGRWAVYRR